MRLLALRVGPGRFFLGAGFACLLLFGLAEAYLRLFPPRDLHAYLGDASPLTGIYQPHEHFAVTYRSWDEFARDHQERLAPHLPLQGHSDPRPVWAFFGNSFVQAPGMLADHAASALPRYRVFRLGRNEHLFIRMAQIELLLGNGLKPERIFFELMPVDLVGLGQQPLDTIEVSAKGALLYRPRYPGEPLGWLVRNSRTAFTAWARAGQQRSNLGFNKNHLCRRLDEPLLGDVRRLFGALADVAAKHRVPITVMLLPTYEQLLRGESWNFQDTLANLFRQQGFDVFDPRAAFQTQDNLPGLFIPDKHYSHRGNQLLLSKLLDHVRGQVVAARGSVP